MTYKNEHGQKIRNFERTYFLNGPFAVLTQYFGKFHNDTV